MMFKQNKIKAVKYAAFKGIVNARPPFLSLIAQPTFGVNCTTNCRFNQLKSGHVVMREVVSSFEGNTKRNGKLMIFNTNHGLNL